MSVEVSLLFLEKKVEAARLCASVTEPVATGSVPGDPKALVADYEEVVTRLSESFADLRSLNGAVDKAAHLEAGDVRNLKQRIAAAVGEVARVAQDLAAQVRFFQAMNPASAALAGKALAKFDEVDRGTREFTVPDGPEEGAEIAPDADEPADDADPMLM